MLTLLPLLLACSSTPSGSSSGGGTDLKAASVTAGRICTFYQRLGKECDHKGPVAETLDLDWAVTATVVQDISVGGSAVKEFEYAVSIDGKPAPALWGRGVGGGTPDEAYGKAADDWARVFGSAIIDGMEHTGKLGALQALQDGQTPPPAFESGTFVVYPGFTDLRGKRSQAKMVDIQAVLGQLAPLSQGWDATPHQVYVSFTRAGSQFTEQNCRLDGKPSTEVCDKVATAVWPEGSYVLKQSFVYVPGPMPADAEKRAQ